MGELARQRLGGNNRRCFLVVEPERRAQPDAPPGTLAARATRCLLDEAVLGERAEMERTVGWRLAEEVPGLGGCQ